MRTNAKEYTVKSNHGLHGLLTQTRKTRNISNTSSVLYVVPVSFLRNVLGIAESIAAAPASSSSVFFLICEVSPAICVNLRLSVVMKSIPVLFQYLSVCRNSHNLPGNKFAALHEGCFYSMFKAAAAGYFHPDDCNAPNLIFSNYIGKFVCIIPVIKFRTAD